MAFIKKSRLSGFGSVQSMASPYILSKLTKPNISVQAPSTSTALVPMAQVGQTVQAQSTMPQISSITDESVAEEANYPATSLPPSVNQPMTSSDYAPAGDGSAAPSMDTSATPATTDQAAAPAAQPDFIDKVASTFNTSRSTAMVGSIGAAVILGMLLLGRRS